jgi:hypothetical protein
MSLATRVKNEMITVGLTTLFFAAWFCMMVLLKKLILSEYQIQFGNLSVALVGALVVAKVVLIMENIPLGAWLRARSGLFHILVRTLMYALGVFVVLLFEKAFEGRHEYAVSSPLWPMCGTTRILPTSGPPRSAWRARC